MVIISAAATRIFVSTVKISLEFALLKSTGGFTMLVMAVAASANFDVSGDEVGALSCQPDNDMLVVHEQGQLNNAQALSEEAKAKPGQIPRGPGPVRNDISDARFRPFLHSVSD